MKVMTLTACALAAVTAFANVDKDEALQEAASDPEVLQELEKSPDGVILNYADDGSLQYIARGSAAYNFGTAKDIRNKTKVAELDAKKRLVNFIEGSVLNAYDGHEESAMEQTSTASDGKTLTMLSSQQDVEMSRSIVEEFTTGRLIGVVVLQTEKVPTEGSQTSGEIRVTIGISDKTRAASDAAHKKISESLRARREADEAVETRGKKDGTAESSADQDPPAGSNKPVIRRSKTIF